jgi:alpha-glucosidase
MLELYRAALRLRRQHAGFRGEAMTWLDAPDGVLRFARSEGLEVLVNVTDAPVAVPADRPLLLSSLPVVDGCLPGDAAAWFG